MFPQLLIFLANFVELLLRRLYRRSVGRELLFQSKTLGKGLFGLFQIALLQLNISGRSLNTRLQLGKLTVSIPRCVQSEPRAHLPVRCTLKI